MKVTNEDFDTLDPRVRAQLLAENGRPDLQGDLERLKRQQRELEDAEYEASTPAAGAWRDRLAQRQRFGRTQDLPRWRPGERGRILTPLQRRELATQAAIAIVMVIVVLGLLAYALFTDPGLS